MKKSVKLILLAVFLIGSYSAQAQLSFGIKGGLNTSNQSGLSDFYKTIAQIFAEDAADIVSVKSIYKPDFHVGIMAQIAIPATNFFIQPELLYSEQGAKIEITDGLDTGKNTISLNYLQLPIYAGYKFDVGLGLNVIAGIGPYFAYGIGGYEMLYYDSLYQRFDAGLTAMAGIQFNKLQITLGFDFGLVDNFDVEGWDTMKDLGGLSSIQNRNLKLSLGYFF